MPTPNTKPAAKTRRDLTGALIRRRKAAVALLTSLSIGVAILAFFAFVRLLPLRGDAGRSVHLLDLARALDGAILRGSDAVANRDRTPKEAQAAWDDVAAAARALAAAEPDADDEEEARALADFSGNLPTAIDLIATAVADVQKGDAALAASARRNAAVALGRLETGSREITSLASRQLDEQTRAARTWLGICLGLVLLTGLMIAVTVVTWAYANFADARRARRLNPGLRADEDAAEAAIRLNVLIERGPLAVLEWNDDFVITRFSGRAEEMFGRKAADVVGKRWDQIENWVHVEDRQRVDEELAPFLRGDVDAVVIRHRNLKPDGAVIHCTWYNCTVREGGNKPRKFLSLADDVTREVIIAQAFRNEAALVRRIADSAPMGISIVDRAGGVIFANDYIIKSMGGKPEDLVGTPVNIADYRLEELDGTPMTDDQRPSAIAFRTGQPVRAREARVRSSFRPDPVPFSITAVPMRDARGQIDSVLLIHDDISQRISAEAEHEALSAELSHARRLETVGNLAGGIAHDFGNALLAISYAADALSAAAAAHRSTGEHAAQLRSAIDVARELTSSLVNYAAGRDGTRKPIDLAAFVSDNCKFVGRLLPPQLKVVCQPGAVPGPVMVNASASQLLQVLINLAVNARDAMPDGGVLTLSVAVDSTGPSPAALLEVADTGQGMSPEARRRAFERYFTTKEPGQGTGIGLSTVHHIVAEHGGTIDVASVPGQGTRFVIRLPLIGSARTGSPPGDAPPVHQPSAPAPRQVPLQAAALAQAARAAAVARPAPTSTIQQPSAVTPSQTPHIPLDRPSRALLVESDDRIRPLIVQTLRNSGYQVESVTTTAAAQDAFQHNPAAWAVILMELDSGGREATAALKRMRQASPSVPALLLTADPIDAQAHPIDDRTRILLKPFTVGSLRSALNDLLSSASTR